MRLRLNFIATSMICMLLCCYSAFAQLHYEGLIYEGQGQALLASASSSAVSPDGRYVYTTSSEDDAITIFERNVTTGDLTFVQSLRNGENEIIGLGGAYDVEVSPDGKHLFVTGSTDHSLVVFSRNNTDGSLILIQHIEDNVAGVDGLRGAYSIGMSPDGNTLYVTGSEEDALVVFNRNVVSGELSFVEMHKKGTGGIGNMAYPLETMVSPDGMNVYVSSLDDSSISVFSRDPNTGSLTFIEDQVDGTGGITGMQGTYSLMVTPDGEQVYATGSYDNALVVFSRNTATGRLSFVQKYVDDTNGFDGLSGGTAVMVSPDGMTVFVAGSDEDAIGIFTRNPMDGTLSFVNTITDGSGGVSGMEYPIALLISPDGENMYTTSFSNGALVSFDLNMTSGSLSYMATTSSGNSDFVGLTGAEDIAVSADNKHLYVAGNTDDGVVVLERDLSTGQLSFVEVVLDNQNGINTLNGVNGVSVSPDGKSVYVTAFWEHAVTVFDRDATTGKLTFREMHRDGISGVDGLNGSNNVRVSADGKNVYASSFWEHGMAVFSRDTNTGALTFLQTLKNGQGGVDGIIRPSSITESPDENHIYVTGAFSNAIAIFSRSATDGSLTYVGVMKDGVNGVNGLRGANSASVSGDGMHVYVAGPSDNGMAVFSRNAGTGMLTFVEYIQNGIDNVGGLAGVNDVEVSTDGKRVYTTSNSENATVVFNRDANTGMLTFDKMQTEGVNGVYGIQGALQVQQDVEGKFIYVAGAGGSTMGIFSCTYIHDTDQTICEGQSYQVAGQTYTTGGDYQQTIIDGSCTHMVDFHLEVQTTNHTVAHEICSGGSFTFDGMTYTTTGQYTGNFTTSQGCDSIVTLNLSVVNELNETLEVSMCDGETYVFGGNNYMGTGSYTNTLTSSAGCDSTVTLNLTVNPTFTTDLEESICEGEFYVFGNRNYNTTGTYTETFTSSAGCDSTVTLRLNVLGNNTVYNESICQGEVFTLGGNDYNVTGNYQVDVQTSSGCDAQVTLNLTVLDSYNIDMNAAICSGETYNFGGMTYTTSGTYTETFTASTGCDSVVVLNLVVSSNEVNLVETICEGDTYVMGSNSYMATGVYTSVLSSMMGCGDSTVTLNLTVVPSMVTENVSICEGESYTVGPNTYTTAGTYIDMVSTGSCMTTNTLTLEVLPSYTTDLNESICTGESYTVGNETFNASGTYTVNLTSTTYGCDSTVTLNLEVNSSETVDMDATICDGESFMIGTEAFTTSGSYTETISTINGCDSVVNLQLTVMPNVSFSGDVTNDSGRGDGAITLSIRGGMAPYTFKWSNDAVTQNISGLTAGTYTVTVVNGNGCERVESFEVQNTTSIKQLEELGLKLQLLNNPAAIGEGAQLRISSPESHQLQLRVFNLAGQMVSAEVINAGIGTTAFDIQDPGVVGIYLIHVSNESGHATTLRLAVQ